MFDSDDLDALVNSTTSAWKTLIIGADLLENCKNVAVEGDGDGVLALLDATRLQAPGQSRR